MKPRLVLLGLIAAVAALALASVASAHSLSEGKATKSAQATANKIVKQSRGDYTSAKVKSCRKLFPHRVECSIGYIGDNKFKYECNEKFMMIYKAHDSDERGNYTVYFDRISRHPC
jgi:hypothetical protein